MRKRILSLFRNLFRQGAVEQALEDELRSSLEVLTQEKMKLGLSPSVARREALLELGGIEQVKEEVRAVRAGRILEDFGRDVRFAFRTLAKTPGFATVTILTLALGIGANTAIFSVLDAVLLRSLPVKDPQQLVVLTWTAHHKPKANGGEAYGDCEAHCSFPLPFFKAIRAQASVFSGMAAFAGPIDVDLSGNGPAAIARGTYVSGDFFSTLGVNMFIGRPLALSDEIPSAAPAIVLSYAYWVRAFGSDRSVIGSSVHLDDTTATIVGVSDPRFTNLTPGKTQDFFMPFSLADRVRGDWWARQERLNGDSEWWVVMLGRLRAGVSVGQAQAAATTVFRNVMLHGPSPAFKEADAPTIKLLPAQSGLDDETGLIAPALYLSMIVVGLILLIACANVAGLMLARSATRRKEMAVRLAVGASRPRLIRQLLTESLLLSLAGGALGVFLALWDAGHIVALISNGSGEPFPYVVEPDWRVLAFAIAVTVATGILFGLAPAMRSSRVDLTPSLKEAASSLRGAAHAARWFSLGDALVVAQVALSIVVLIGAGLLVRTLRNLETLNPGFDTHNVLLFDIDPTIAGDNDQQTQQLYSNLQQRFAALPGVMSVSYSEEALLDGGWSGDHIHLDSAPPKQNIHIKVLPVGLDFFSTMRIPILAGRAFTRADFATAIATNAAQQKLGDTWSKKESASTPSPALAAAYTSAQQAYSHSAPVPVLINASFAREYFPNQNPVGLHVGDSEHTDNEVRHPGPGYAVIGITGDTKYARLRSKTVPIMFLPLLSNAAYFELRAAGNPTALVKSVREIVSSAGDNLPLTHVLTQTEQTEQLLLRERLLARFSSFYGGLALILACMGLYGLLSYEGARRTREMGIRTALGGRQRDLLRLVAGQGIALALIGAVIGAGAAIGVTRFMSSMLFGVRADDPVTIIAVVSALIAVALLACYFPARRAAKVDPMAALRCE